MSKMFFGCKSLKEINVSNFIINNQSDISLMFSGCSTELKNAIREQNPSIGEEAFM